MQRNPLWDARAKAFLEAGGAGTLMPPDVPTSLADLTTPQVPQVPVQQAGMTGGMPPPMAQPPMQSPQPPQPPPVWEGKIPSPIYQGEFQGSQGPMRQKPPTQRTPYDGFEHGRRPDGPQAQPPPEGWPVKDVMQLRQPQPALQQAARQETVNQRTPFRYRKDRSGTDY